MNKELTPLEALENIKHYDSRVGLHESDYEIIKTALKILEQLQVIIGAEKIEDLPKLALETENTCYSACYNLKEAEKKLKALEIIKSFNDYQIVEVQGKWYLMRGIEFGKSIKMPITKEQADLLKEVLL